jgi:hypothetical protein
LHLLHHLDAADIAEQLMEGDEIDLEAQMLGREDVKKLAQVLEHAACPPRIALSLRDARVPTLTTLLQAAATNKPLAGLDLHGLRIRTGEQDLVLQPEHVTLIAGLLGRDSRMSMLDLGDQMLGARGWPAGDQRMPTAFQGLMMALWPTSSLTVLRLDGCRLADEELGRISFNLFSRADLLQPVKTTEIGLSFNEFTAESAADFVRVVGQFDTPVQGRVERHLRVFDLQGTQFDERGEALCLTLAEQLGTLHTLEPYSSARPDSLTQMGSQIVRQLDDNRWKAWGPRVLLMAESLSNVHVPPDLIRAVGALIISD